MRHSKHPIGFSFIGELAGSLRQTVGRLGLIALVIAAAGCGGGGGSDTPRFQETSVNGVVGIRDNTTGLVWAKTFPTTAPTYSRLPYASELLRLVHTTSVSERNATFSFAFSSSNPPFTLAEAAPVQSGTARVWAVDVGGYFSADFPAGTLLSQAQTDPAKQWYLLFSAASVAPSYPLSVSNDVVYSDPESRLMWRRCVEGTTWNASTQQCSDGAAASYTHDQAISQAQAARYGGYSNWRIPTLLELQYLLALDNTAGPYISASAFKDVNTQVDWVNVQAFRTATQATTNTHWTVDFRLGEVVPITSDTAPLPLLLVRSRW